ncbi:MAG: hypothetical protein M3342_12035 [Bacteroidota bacterium]|nr:hypothetical protein [Bacteroidota bacterium]
MFGNNMFGMDKDDAQNQVGELVGRLKERVGLSDEQAQKVLETIKEFLGEKFPMLQGYMDSMLGDK